MSDFILHLAPGYLYPALFFGISLLGGVVLLPALFLAIAGKLKLAYLFGTVLLAGFNSDSIWYAVGRRAKKDRLYRIPFVQKRILEADRFSEFFSRHSLWLLYVTKFIYGTRVASHVLAGMHKVKYVYFLLATGLGTATWFWFFYFVVHSLNHGMGNAKSAALKLQLTMLTGAVLIISLNWITGTYVRKKLLKKEKGK